MENIYRNCKSLPLEILQNIFQFSPAQQLCQCALVCKTWLTPAQTALYSNIEIKALLQLRKFYGTVRDNPCLGGIVKKVYLEIDLPHFMDYEENQLASEEMTILLKNLLSTCLPNLEEMEDDMGHSYIPLLTALLDFQLGRLKRISTPCYGMEKIEKANYDTCVLLLRDRIEKIVILHEYLYNHNEERNRVLYPNRLYEKLHQFDKLVELDIGRRTNDGIQILENVVAACKSLKKLAFDFRSLEDSRPQNNNISINTISTFTPCYDIKCLEAKLFTSNNYKILLYMMHKFTQLDEFSLTMDRLRSARLDNNMITQLMNYCSKIDSFSLSNLPVDDRNIVKTIESNWSLTSKPGSESLKLLYSSEFSDRTAYLLGFSKSKNAIGTTLSLEYPIKRIDEHDEFIEKYGEYIGQLQFGFSLEDSPRHRDCKIPDHFIAHVIEHCPNLKTLKFEECLLNRLKPSKIDLRKRLVLDELHFKNSILSAGFLEQCSLLLPEVKRLRFTHVSFRNDEDQNPDSSELRFDYTESQISMQNTNIDHFIFELEENDYPKIFYVRVFSMVDDDYYYYQFNEHLKAFETTNEQVYSEAPSFVRLNICCKMHPTIHFEYIENEEEEEEG